MNKKLIYIIAALAVVGVMITLLVSSKKNIDDISTTEAEITEENVTSFDTKIVDLTEEQVVTARALALEIPVNITEQKTKQQAVTYETAIQTKSEETTNIIEITSTETQEYSDALYSATQFKVLGVIRWNGWRWTYYSEKVLPGGGLNIPGRHNDSNGYVCDENNYICLSSSTLSNGTVIDTPFGKHGKVYDTGCAADVIDVYVSW